MREKMCQTVLVSFKNLYASYIIHNKVTATLGIQNFNMISVFIEKGIVAPLGSAISVLYFGRTSSRTQPLLSLNQFL